MFEVQGHARFVARNPRIVPWADFKRLARPDGSLFVAGTLDNHMAGYDIADVFC